LSTSGLVQLQHLLILLLNETRSGKRYMAYYNHITTNDDFISRILGSAANLLNTTIARYEKHRIYHRTLRELTVLSSRELADLGLHRTEVKRIAWEAAYGTPTS